ATRERPTPARPRPGGAPVDRRAHWQARLAAYTREDGSAVKH
ncbi:MAG: hypothetical protein JWM31_1369, partial [Solirubrobacterales bacterium]|nr:hypothetical protein [Solirubrobacterales bacterium]